MKDRIHQLVSSDIVKDRKVVLYWLQSTQRTAFNYGLSHAIHVANRLGLPLRVLFVLNPAYPDANQRHYQFMLEGFEELREDILRLNAEFVVAFGDVLTCVKDYLMDAAYGVMDFGYLSHHKVWREALSGFAKEAGISLDAVESDVIVPLEKGDPKCTYSARTLRPKLLRVVEDYLGAPKLESVIEKPLNVSSSVRFDALMKRLNGDDSVTLVSQYFVGGRKEALRRLDTFINHALKDYLKSQDPSTLLTSHLSPYLHFGMVAPHEIYLAVASYIDTYPEAVESYLEQLLVRRELAFNFVYYCKGYDQFETMTYDWAYDTMLNHRDDPREYIYSIEELSSFQTHDVYFNAAMKEMVKTGYMHNYMRMYWGKKIIEWSKDYKTAYETIIYLNNKYFLDGRDPNSYASVAWLFGRHDRAWQEREIFGKLRYMNENGLKRKFEIDKYVAYVNAI